MKPELSIIIPTKDRQIIFNKTLSSLIEATKNINVEIIIINDSEKELSVKNFNKNIFIFKNPKKGVASARNFGVKKSSSDYILFLDDDILVNEENVKVIIDFLKKEDNNIYLLNWIYPENLINRIKYKKFGRYLINNNLVSLKGWINKSDLWKDNELFEVPIGASYCLPILKSTFNSINGYNEKFNYAGAEDYDFFKRLKSIGIKFYIYPLSTVYHNEEDRIELINWLERKKRDSYTKKQALTLGYTEFKANYSFIRYNILNFTYSFRFIFLIILKLIPNLKIFDKLSFMLISVLCASYIYKGYNEN